MSDLEKLEAKLERTMAFATAQSLALRLVCKEMDKLSPGTSDKVVDALLSESGARSERTEVQKRQITAVAALIKS